MRMPNRPRAGSHEEERIGIPAGIDSPRHERNGYPVEWTLDGSGQGKIDTGIRFFDHMLELLSKHGFFDLTVQAKGDIDIDEHHTVEDVGIVMGKALHQALGEKAGIKRFGFASAPLDETLAQVTVDLSGTALSRLQRQAAGSEDQGLRPRPVRRLLPGLRHPRRAESARESHVRPQPAPHHGSHLQRRWPKPWIRPRCWKNGWQGKCCRRRECCKSRESVAAEGVKGAGCVEPAPFLFQETGVAGSAWLRYCYGFPGTGPTPNCNV